MARDDVPCGVPGVEPVPQVAASRSRPVIAVIGDGLETTGSEAAAYGVGEALAKAGVHLVCGGLGGCMAGAARGYRESGGPGIVLGLLPGSSRDEGNAWLDLALPTGVNQAQSALVAVAVDAAIIVGGGGGTLSEVGLLLRDRKPVVALRGSGGVADLVGGKALGEQQILAADSGGEAVRRLLSALGR